MSDAFNSGEHLVKPSKDYEEKLALRSLSPQTKARRALARKAAAARVMAGSLGENFGLAAIR